MSDNLIQQVHGIEQEADLIVKKAHEEVAELERRTDDQNDQLRRELDERFKKESVEIAQQIEADQKAEEEALQAKANKALETIKTIASTDIAPLVQSIVERIHNS